MLNARFYLTISSHDLNKFNFEMINNCCFGHLVLDGKLSLMNNQDKNAQFPFGITIKSTIFAIKNKQC